MIKINKNDSIIDIINKINNCKQKEIILDIPFWHPILHNYTSLKILKNKSWKKELILITSDKTAKNIWKKLGIKYSQLWDVDLLEYNYSFLEYTKYILKRYIIEISQIFSRKTPDFIFEYHKKYSSNNSKIGIFLFWLIISIFLFLFIFYFAVNKTYIEITPEIEIKTKSQNFVFRESETWELSNNPIIQLKKISKLYYLSSKFWTSWVSEETVKRSKWKVTFYNELNEPIQLLSNTRLKTKDWILFTTDTPVNIEKASISSTWQIIPWKVEINITSSLHDTEWKVLWNKSNIWTWVLLTLPWLKTNNDKIYAKTTSLITWWNNNYTKILTQKDIDNAKNILEWKLKQESLNELKKQILQENEKNNITYDILWVDDILIYSNLEIKWDENLKIWDKIDNFELTWTIKITSYIYNTEKVLNELSTTIKNLLLKDYEKLLFVNNKTLRISQVLNKNEKPFEIKATVQVEAFFSQIFLSEKNNYIQKLKTSIVWIKKDEALKILLNNPKISQVKIDIRPFFMKSISKILDNIEVKVVEKK